MCVCGMDLIELVDAFRWKPLLAGLRCLEKLLKRRQLRERFAAVCVEPIGGEAGHHLLFISFSPKLGGLRWQVVTEFCRAVARLVC